MTDDAAACGDDEVVVRRSGDAIGKDGEEKNMMVRGFIPKQAFHKELKSVVQQMDAWALEYVDGLGKSESTALLLKGTDNAWELKKLSKNLEEQYGQLQAALGDQREAMIRYNEWMAHVKEKDFELAGRITQLLDSKRRGEDKVSVAMADISSKLDYRKQKLDALRKATSWYKELLGIRCEYSNAVRFIFTNIDSTNSDREFSFSIHHDKIDNKFSKRDRDETRATRKKLQVAEEAKARVTCRYYPSKNGKEALETVLEEVKALNSRNTSTFETMPRVSIRWLGRLLPEVKWATLPLMEISSRKEQKSGVRRAWGKRVLAFWMEQVYFWKDSTRTLRHKLHQ